MNVDSFIVLVTDPRIHTLDVRLAPAIQTAGFRHIPADLGRISSLTDLTLSFGYLRPESIGRILTIPREPTRFSYTHHPLDRKLIGPAFGHPLQRSVGHSLQRLRLNRGTGVGWGHDSQDTNLGTFFTIWSLAKWRVWNSVKCSLTPLLGRGPGQTQIRLVDVLGRVLCEVEIEKDRYWSTGEMVDAVTEMVQTREGRLEQLGVFTVPMEAEELSVKRLQVACEAPGVRMTVDESFGLPCNFKECWSNTVCSWCLFCWIGGLLCSLIRYTYPVALVYWGRGSKD